MRRPNLDRIADFFDFNLGAPLALVKRQLRGLVFRRVGTNAIFSSAISWTPSFTEAVQAP